jgi:hypothetical protein
MESVKPACFSSAPISDASSGIASAMWVIRIDRIERVASHHTDFIDDEELQFA